MNIDVKLLDKALDALYNVSSGLTICDISKSLRTSYNDTLDVIRELRRLGCIRVNGRVFNYYDDIPNWYTTKRTRRRGNKNHGKNEKAA